MCVRARDTRGGPTEEHVLEHDGLLREAAKVAVGERGRAVRDGLLLDAGPGEVDVEEQQEDAEADDGRVELVVVPHQGVVQQVAVDLGLDEHQVDEEHDVVMLDVFVAEAAAVAAHRQADVVAARLVAGARVLGPQRLDGVAAFYADRHRGRSVASSLRSSRSVMSCHIMSVQRAIDIPDKAGDHGQCVVAKQRAWRVQVQGSKFEFRYESGSGFGANQSGGHCKLIHVAIE